MNKCPHCEFIETTFKNADTSDKREYWLMTEVFVYLHKGESCNYVCPECGGNKHVKIFSLATYGDYEYIPCPKCNTGKKVEI